MKYPTPLVLAMIVISLGAASSSADPHLLRTVIAGGAGATDHGVRTLCLTVGQPLIGVMSNSADTVRLGFWYLPAQPASGIGPSEVSLPTEYALRAVHPKPCSRRATLLLAIPQQSHVTLRVFDAAGRRVRVLLDGRLEPGFHSVSLQVDHLATGVYFCRMTAQDFAMTRRVVLLRCPSAFPSLRRPMRTGPR